MKMRNNSDGQRETFLLSTSVVHKYELDPGETMRVQQGDTGCVCGGKWVIWWWPEVYWWPECWQHELTWRSLITKTKISIRRLMNMPGMQRVMLEPPDTQTQRTARHSDFSNLRLSALTGGFLKPMTNPNSHNWSGLDSDKEAQTRLRGIHLIAWASSEKSKNLGFGNASMITV